VYGDAESNLGRISEVVDAHNQLVSTYLSNSTTQTKGIILSTIRRMLGFVSEIRRGLFYTIQQYISNKRDATYTNYINKYLHDIVVALVAYDIIKEQLRTTNVYVTSYNERQNRVNALLARYPNLIELFRQFRLGTTPGGGTGWPPSSGPPGLGVGPGAEGHSGPS